MQKTIQNIVVACLIVMSKLANIFEYCSWLSLFKRSFTKR